MQVVDQREAAKLPFHSRYPSSKLVAWLLDCLDSKPCHSLLETVVRLEDEGLLGEVMRRSRASAGGGG